ncbi:RNA recognition motif domain [Trinorchestia longiramus]|nr:RNA recognition motif domain [Trinorchestia longiramus]
MYVGELLCGNPSYPSLHQPHLLQEFVVGLPLLDRAKSKSSIELPFAKTPFDGSPQSLRPDLPGVGPPADAPIANYGHPLPPIHPMDCGPVGHEIPPVIDFNGPASSLIGARLEPMLPPTPAALPPASFSEPVHETFGLSPDYLANLNVELPLVPKVFISNVDPRASENDVGDLVSVAGTVVTVQINRHLQQAIVEMAHPVEAVEAISRLNHHPLHDQRIAVRLCRRRDFEIVNGLPITEDLPLPSGIGHGAGLPYAYGQALPNHLATQMLPSGFDPIHERPLPPPGGHNFRGPTDAPFDAVQSDDLRSSLSRPGCSGRGPPPPAAAGTHSDTSRDSPSLLSKKLDHVSEEKYGFGRGRGSTTTRGRGNLTGTPFWHSRGGLGFSAVNRSNSMNAVTSSADDRHPADQATTVAGRGTSGALSNREANSVSVGRGVTSYGGEDGNNVPPGRGGGNNVPIGRGDGNNVPTGRGGGNNVPTGRGGGNNGPTGRGGGNNGPTGRGGGNNVSTGRGGVNNVSPGRGGGNNGPTGRGGGNNVPTGRGGGNNVPTGRGGGNNVSPGRGGGNNGPTGRGGGNNAPTGRGDGNNVLPATGGGNNVPTGRGIIETSIPGRASMNNAQANGEESKYSPVDTGTNVHVHQEAFEGTLAAKANSSAAGSGGGNNPAAGRGGGNNPAAGRGGGNNPAAGRGGGRGAADSPAAGRGATNNPAAGRGAANNRVAGRGAFNSPAAGRGAASSLVTDRGAVNSPATGRGASNSPAAGRGAFNSPAAGRGASNNPAASRGANNSPAAGRGAANSTPAGGGAINSTPAVRDAIASTPVGTVVSNRFAAGGAKGPDTNRSAAVESGHKTNSGEEVNGSSADERPTTPAPFSHNVTNADTVSQGTVTNTFFKKGITESVKVGDGSNTAAASKGSAISSLGKPSTVAAPWSGDTALCPAGKGSSNSSTGTETAKNPNWGTATSFAGTGAVITALANRGTLASSASGEKGIFSHGREATNYVSICGESTTNNSTGAKATNYAPAGRRVVNTSVNNDSTESVVTARQTENVTKESSNTGFGNQSNFGSIRMKTACSDSEKQERGARNILPGRAIIGSGSVTVSQSEGGNPSHKVASVVASRVDKTYNSSEISPREAKIPVIGKAPEPVVSLDGNAKMHSDIRQDTDSRISSQSYPDVKMGQRDFQEAYGSDKLNPRYESQLPGISPITVVMDAAVDRKSYGKHSGNHGAVTGNFPAHYDPVRDHKADSGTNLLSNSSILSSGGVWRSGSPVVSKPIDAITSARSHSKDRNSEKDKGVNDQWNVSGAKRDIADVQEDVGQSGPISKRIRSDHPSYFKSNSGPTREQFSFQDSKDNNPYLRDRNRMNSTNRLEQTTSFNSPITNVSDQTYRIPAVWEGKSYTGDNTDRSNFPNSEQTDNLKTQKNSRYGNEDNRDSKFERIPVSFESRKIANVPLTVDYGHKSGLKNAQMRERKEQYTPAFDDNPYLRGDSPVRSSSVTKSRPTNWPNTRDRDTVESNRKGDSASLHNRGREPARPWSGEHEAYRKAITKDWQHGSTPRDLTYGRPSESNYSDTSRFSDFPSSARMNYSASGFYGRSADMRVSHLPPPISGGPPRSAYPDVHAPPVGATLARSSLFAPSQSAKLVINNLPGQVNKRDLSELCGRFGMVREIDHDTKAFKSRVIFANAQDARIAARERAQRPGVPRVDTEGPGCLNASFLHSLRPELANHFEGAEGVGCSTALLQHCPGASNLPQLLDYCFPCL